MQSLFQPLSLLTRLLVVLLPACTIRPAAAAAPADAAAQPPPKPPEPLERRANPADPREYLLRYSQPQTQYADFFAECLAEEVRKFLPYECNARWPAVMSVCSGLAKFYSVQNVLDTEDYLRMLAFEPYVQCLEETTKQYAPRPRKAFIDFFSYKKYARLRDPPELEPKCYPETQWFGGADLSLQQAKEACAKTLPESVVPLSAAPLPRNYKFRPPPMRWFGTTEGSGGQAGYGRLALAGVGAVSPPPSSSRPKSVVAQLSDEQAWRAHRLPLRKALAPTAAVPPKPLLQGRHFVAPR